MWREMVSDSDSSSYHPYDDDSYYGCGSQYECDPVYMLETSMAIDAHGVTDAIESIDTSLEGSNDNYQKENVEGTIESVLSDFQHYAFLRPMRRYVKKRMEMLIGKKGTRPKTSTSTDNVKPDELEVVSSVSEIVVAALPTTNNRIESTAALYTLNSIVEVAPRMWPGSNKQGGTARITGVVYANTGDNDGSYLYNVRYTVVGGSEKGVEEKYLRNHSEVSHTIRKAQLKGRCRVEHCPCFVMDCNHRQPGEDGFEEEQLGLRLGQLGLNRSTEGGRIIALVKSKLKNKSESMSLLPCPIIESATMQRTHKQTVTEPKKKKKKKTKPPIRNASRDIARDKSDVNNRISKLDSLATLIRDKTHTFTVVAAIEAEVEVVTDATHMPPSHEMIKEKISKTYKDIVRLYKQQDTDQDNDFIQPEGYTVNERVDRYVHILQHLDTPELFALVELLNSRLIKDIGSIVLLGHKALSLRNTMDRVREDEVISLAMDVVAIVDAFAMVDLQTTRTVLDVFDSVTYLIRPMRQCFSKPCKHQWMLLHRQQANLFEEWKNERSTTSSSIKALHARFEYENGGMTVEDVLEESDADSHSDSGADGDSDDSDGDSVMPAIDDTLVVKHAMNRHRAASSDAYRLQDEEEFDDEWVPARDERRSLAHSSTARRVHTSNRNGSRYSSTSGNRTGDSGGVTRSNTIGSVAREGVNATSPDTTYTDEEEEGAAAVVVAAKGGTGVDGSGSGMHRGSSSSSSRGRGIEHTKSAGRANTSRKEYYYSSRVSNGRRKPHIKTDADTYADATAAAAVDTYTDAIGGDADVYAVGDHRQTKHHRKDNKSNSHCELDVNASISTFIRHIRHIHPVIIDTFAVCGRSSTDDWSRSFLSQVWEQHLHLHLHIDKQTITCLDTATCVSSDSVMEDVFAAIVSSFHRMVQSGDYTNFGKLTGLLFGHDSVLLYPSSQQPVLSTGTDAFATQYFQLLHEFEENHLLSRQHSMSHILLPRRGDSIDIRRSIALQYLMCKLHFYIRMVADAKPTALMKAMMKVDVSRLYATLLSAAMANHQAAAAVIRDVYASTLGMQYSTDIDMYLCVLCLCVRCMVILEVKQLWKLVNSTINRPDDHSSPNYPDCSSPKYPGYCLVTVADQTVYLQQMKLHGCHSIHSKQEAYWIVIALHSFALLHSNAYSINKTAAAGVATTVTIPNNWAGIRHFCCVTSIDSCEEQLRHYFDRMALLARVWDNSVDGVEVLLHTASTIALHGSAVYRHCHIHGSGGSDTAAAVDSKKGSKEAEVKEDRVLELYLIKLLYRLIESSSGTSTSTSTDKRIEMQQLVSKLFVALDLGDIYSDTNSDTYSIGGSRKTMTCGCSWFEVGLVHKGLRQFIIAALTTSASTHSNASVDTSSIVAKKIRAMLIKDTGVLRLLGTRKDASSLYEWVLLSLLVAEVTSIYDVSMFDDRQLSVAEAQAGAASLVLQNNRILNVLVFMSNQLTYTQRTCVTWLLCAVSFCSHTAAPISPLSCLMSSEVIDYCEGVNIAVSSDSHLYICGGIVGTASMILPSAFALKSMLVTLAACLVCIQYTSDPTHVIEYTRITLANSMILSNRIFGNTKQCYCIIATLSTCYSIKHLHDACDVTLFQGITHTCTYDASYTYKLLSLLSQFLLPTARAGLLALVNAGVEAEPTFCFCTGGIAYQETAASRHITTMLTQHMTGYAGLQLSKALYHLLDLLCTINSSSDIAAVTRSSILTVHDLKALNAVEVYHTMHSLLSDTSRQHSNPILSWLSCSFWSRLMCSSGSSSGSGSIDDCLLHRLLSLRNSNSINVYQVTQSLVDTWLTCIAAHQSQPLVIGAIDMLSLHNSIIQIASYIPCAANTYSTCNISSSSSHSKTRQLSCLLSTLGFHQLQILHTTADVTTHWCRRSFAAAVSMIINGYGRMESDDTHQSQLFTLATTPVSGGKSLVIAQVILKCTRHLMLSSFRTNDATDTFALTLQSMSIRSCLLAAVIRSTCFDRQDLVQCITHEVYDDYFTSQVSNALAMCRSDAATPAMLQQQQQQEVSIFVAHLSLYIRCIPSLAYSTRHTEWTVLLHLLVHACNRYHHHCNSSVGKRNSSSNSMCLKALTAWSIAISLPIAADVNLLNLPPVAASTPVLNAIQAVTVSLLKVMSVCDSFVTPATSSATAVGADDRLMHFRQYLLLRDAPWIDIAERTRHFKLQQVLLTRVYLSIHASYHYHLSSLMPSRDEVVNVLCCCCLVCCNLYQCMAVGNDEGWGTDTDMLLNLILLTAHAISRYVRSAAEARVDTYANHLPDLVTLVGEWKLLVVSMLDDTGSVIDDIDGKIVSVVNAITDTTYCMSESSGECCEVSGCFRCQSMVYKACKAFCDNINNTSNSHQRNDWRNKLLSTTSGKIKKDIIAIIMNI